MRIYIDRTRRGGFTLIELLIVVAIIAMLAAIMLPSLAKARELARAVACQSNLKHIGTGLTTYTIANHSWLPGSPLTTGFPLANNYTGSVNDGNYGDWPTNSNGEYKYFGVVEWMDWATPIKREFNGDTALDNPDPNDLHATRASMYKTVVDEPFLCPSNDMVIEPYSPDPGIARKYPFIQAVSYLSMWTMMRGGWNTRTNARYLPQAYEHSPGSTSDTFWAYVAQNPDWDLEVPANYLPKLSNIKRATMKVFLADGFRYYAKTSQGREIIDYTVQWANPKGMMSGTPPSTYSKTESHAREYYHAKRQSWRHVDNDTINSVFFDGHVQTMKASTEKDGRWDNDSLHPKYYYPTGTIVKNSDELHIELPPNTILP